MQAALYKEKMKKKSDKTHKNNTGAQDNVNRRERTEEKLYQEEQGFRAFVEHSSDIIVIVNREGIITYINPAVEIVLGFKPEERIGASGFELVHPNDMKFLADSFNTLARDTNSPIIQGEMRLRHKDGSWRKVEGVGSNLIHNNVVEAVIVNYRDITERKQTEKALRQSEEKYRTFIETIQDGYYEIDLNGKYTFVNDVICEHLQYSREELIGKDNRLYQTKENAKKVYHAFKEVYLTGKSVKAFEMEVIRKDGTIRISEVSISLIRNAEGNPIAFRGTSRDITGRKLIEEALRQSEEKYRTILEDIQEGYFEVDFAGNFTSFNDSLCLFLGYSKEELMGMNNRQYTDKEHSKKLFQAFNKVYNTGKPTEGFDWQIIRKDGTKRYVEASVSLQKDSSDKPTGFRGIARDVTDRKKVEDALKNSELKYRNIFENAVEGIYQSTIEGRFITANAALARMAGYDSSEEFIESIKDIGTQFYVHPKDRKKLIETSKAKDFVNGFEVEFYKKDGSIFWGVINARTVKDEQGKILYIEGLIEDITIRKHAEEQLHQTLESLRKAVGTTIQVLITASEARDPYTAGHQKMVADLACAIAIEMGLAQEKIEGIRMAGSIHDIGKLSIPAEILSKPTNLSEIEFSLIKEHAQSGYEMLKDVESPWPLAEIVYQHHERMNGSGYPRNLKGNEILMESRILAVADVVEAMASHRPYRPTLGIEAALEEIEKNKGILYDDAVADACLRLFREKGYQLI
jgi:PAS domain S-box-containing protein/putative nucleotidyltransferase with HDIG domain